MPVPDIDRAFAGSSPRTYETYLVPMIFEPYAVDIAGRLRTIPAAGGCGGCPAPTTPPARSARDLGRGTC